MSWLLDVVFVAWVLYITATGHLLPSQFSLQGGGGRHPMNGPQPVTAPVQNAPSTPFANTDAS